MSIVVIGSAFVDIKGYPKKAYIPKGRNSGKVYHIHGGVGRNIAEDIANVGLNTIFVSTLDETGLSDDVLKILNERMINTNYIKRVQDGLGTWLAIFDNDGDVMASISKRPDLSHFKGILEEYGDEIFRQARSVVVEIDLPGEVIEQVFDYAKQYNIPVFAVVSNMSIALKRRDLIRRSACFVCNQQEVELFFAESFNSYNIDELVERIAQKAKEAAIDQIVVTLGEHGAIYASDVEKGHVPAHKVDVLDTTGCGDAFFAGVAIGLTYKKSLKESCQIGVRLASSVIATTENVNPVFRPAEFDIVV